MESFGIILLVAALILVFSLLVKKIFDYLKWCKKFDSFPKMDSPPIIRDIHNISTIRHWSEKFHQSKFKELGWLTIWLSYYPIITIFKSKPAHIILSRTSFLDRGWPVRTACKYEHLISLPGRRWKDRRAIINPSFSLDVIQSFVPTVVQHAESLIEKIKIRGDSSFDFHELIMNQMISATLDTSIGLEKSSDWLGKEIIKSELNEFSASLTDRIRKPYLWIEIINDIRNLIMGRWDPFASCKLQVDEVIRAYLEVKEQDTDQCFDDGKKKRKPFLANMIDEFVNQSKEKKPSFSHDELLIETIIIIIASYETISNSVRWTLFNLASNLHIQEKLYQELQSFDDDRYIDFQYLDSFKYLDQCILESLRLRPPLAMTCRQIEHSIVLDGFDIPKDTLMVISISAVHRDETIYPSPEVFDPDRFTPENRAKIPPGGYIPFGGGPRKCIGWKLALLETKILVAHIVKNFIVHAENQVELKILNEVLLVPEKPIMFRFIPRS